MTDVRYTPTELERATENVANAEHSDAYPIYTWARYAKVLWAALEAAQAEVEQSQRAIDYWIEISANPNSDIEFPE